MTTILLNLVVIRSANIEQSLQFYGWIGLTFAQHRHGNGPQHYACELGSLIFEIYPQTEQTQSSATTRIGFQVNDLDALLENLKAHNAPLISPAKDSPWGRRAIVDDPDGHRIELVEPTDENAP